MSAMTLPPGFRFHPNDHELVGYYLKRKVEGIKIELEVIPVIDLYKFDPWELPDKSFLPKRDMEWFFFCPRDRKYPNGSRTNRATCSGYWKATGRDRKIFCENYVFGLRKTLVFYRGRAPGGLRTDWIMHEYRLCNDFSQGTISFVGGFALCRIVKRSENGVKFGGSYGESKMQHSFSMPNLKLRGNDEKLSDGAEESSSIVTNQFDRSINSTPISSPQAERELEIQPIILENDEMTFWEHQVIDISKASFIDESVPITSEPFSSLCMSYIDEACLAHELHENKCFLSTSSLNPTLDNSEGIAFEWFESQATKDISAYAFDSANFLTSPLLC